MVSPTNPLDRGRAFDILLNSLLEAGVDTSTLAFMLGVNPDTMSAYLMRSSEAGSLRVIAGTDWFSEDTITHVLIPRASYNLNDGEAFPSITTSGLRMWEFIVWGATGASNLAIPHLQLQIAFEGGPNQATMYLPFGLGYLNLTRMVLPQCRITPVIGADANLGTWDLAVSMQSVPVGG